MSRDLEQRCHLYLLENSQFILGLYISQIHGCVSKVFVHRFISIKSHYSTSQRISLTFFDFRIRHSQRSFGRLRESITLQWDLFYFFPTTRFVISHNLISLLATKRFKSHRPSSTTYVIPSDLIACCKINIQMRCISLFVLIRHRRKNFKWCWN